jgi:cyanuric acid amidohydrolase
MRSRVSLAIVVFPRGKPAPWRGGAALPIGAGPATLRSVNRSGDVMQARVHRIPAAAPDDFSGIAALAQAGALDPARVIAVLGKTEGNGCVNDFTRGFATTSLKAGFAALTGRSLAEVEQGTLFVMSGGTEGGLSPHWLVFEVADDAAPPVAGRKALALGSARTRAFAPQEVGRMPQVRATAQAVREAMAQAGIVDEADVHYVQVKCPLLTRARIEQAHAEGHSVAAEETYASMGASRGASALGVALALGEVADDALGDAKIGRDDSLFSRRASSSAGVELLENQILVVGNSAAWSGDLLVAHDLMADAIDAAALARALSAAGIAPALPLPPGDAARLVAVLAKAEAARGGTIRGARHTMLDDSDIQASRHARAMVGGALAAVAGTTLLFVSGGAEHQGPDGGGPVAIIVRRSI